eukprot:323858-Rhodomonas_salina.7
MQFLVVDLAAPQHDCQNQHLKKRSRIKHAKPVPCPRKPLLWHNLDFKRGSKILISGQQNQTTQV